MFSRRAHHILRVHLRIVELWRHPPRVVVLPDSWRGLRNQPLSSIFWHQFFGMLMLRDGSFRPLHTPVIVCLIAGALRSGVCGEQEHALVGLGGAAGQELTGCPQPIPQVFWARLRCAPYPFLKSTLCKMSWATTMMHWQVRHWPSAVALSMAPWNHPIPLSHLPP
jgi:hypothetical protein